MSIPNTAQTTPFPLSTPAPLTGTASRLLWLLIALGLGLRIFHFVDNRSFWIDELYLNGNLIRMSFWELATQPLAYQQKAPLGYLGLVKLAVWLFGPGERALRLVSLLSGGLALGLFVPVARRFLQPWTAVLAVGILALGEPFIYHAVEAKQYSTELCAAVVAWWLVLRFYRAQTSRDLLLWGLGGGLLLWFSYSAIFLLAGFALILSVHHLRTQGWLGFGRRLIPFTVWLVSFGLIHYFFLRHYQDTGWLRNFFAVVYKAYMPLPPASGDDLVWFAYTHYMLLERPLGLLLKFGNLEQYSPLQTLLRLPLLPLLLEAVGLVALLRRQSFAFSLLLTPVLLTLIASGLQLYPFYERFILFLAPSLILLIAYGAETVVAWLGPTYYHLAAGVLAALLLLVPLWNATQFTLDPAKFYKKEYNREAALFVHEHYQPGDVVYFYWNMRHVHEYYHPAYALRYEAVGGADLRHIAANAQAYHQALVRDLGDLQGKKRLWVIHNPRLRNNIGDYPNQAPAWYHAVHFSPSAALAQTATAVGAIPLDSFQRRSIDVRLYQLPAVDKE